MDSNDTDVEKSIGRTMNTCAKPWCDGIVNTKTVTEGGMSVEYEHCSNGHRIRRRVLDRDGAYRTFKGFPAESMTIRGP